MAGQGGNPDHTSMIYRAIVGTAIVFAVLMAALFLRWGGPGPVLIVLPWFIPVVSLFQALILSAVASLALGRYDVLKDAASFWVGMGTAGFAVALVFYALTWPELLPGGEAFLASLYGTPTWFLQIGLTILWAFLLAAVVVHRPKSEKLTGRRLLLLTASWIVLLTIAFTLIIGVEQSLPLLVTETGISTTPRLIWNIALGILFAGGAVLSTRRYRETGDALLGYIAFAQVGFAFGMFATVGGMQRYDLWWYLMRAILTGSALVVLFGLIYDYMTLFRREKEKTDEVLKAEEALRESEERLRAVLENSLDAVYRRNLRLDGYDYMSPVVEQILGFTPEEMNAMHIGEVLDRIHPGDRSPVEVELTHAARSGRGLLEYRFRSKNGEYRWLADHFTVITDARGQPLYRNGVVRDVTGQKRAEERLRESEERLALALDAARLAPWTIDLSTGAVIPSGALAELFGVSNADEMTDRAAWRAYVLEEDRPLIQPAIEAAIAGNTEYRNEYRIRRPSDGSIRWISSQGLVLRDSAGRPLLLIGVASDITEQKHAEEERARLYSDLENAHRETNLYLDILTHDVRNANNVSLMYSEILIEELEGDQKEHARKLKAGIDRSTEILRNVATIRRIHQERIALKPISLDEVIRKEIAELPLAKIRYSAAPRYVCADELLSAVFANLLGNATKFGGPDAGIAVLVEDLDGEVLVSVEDTGPGVPDDQKGRLFHRFEHGRSKASGQGLGLYIVRTLVERYGGRVRAEDRVPGHPEQGAAFRFTLKKA